MLKLRRAASKGRFPIRPVVISNVVAALSEAAGHLAASQQNRNREPKLLANVIIVSILCAVVRRGAPRRPPIVRSLRERERQRERERERERERVS